MSNQREAISALRKKIEKAYKDSTEIFPSVTSIRKIPTIRSRSVIINAVTGIGGFPRGRVIEVYGPESSGKTTFGIDAVVSLQEQDPDGVALFLDFEHAIDLRYARTLGADLDEDKFILAQPECLEQGVTIADQFVTQDLVDLIIIDSAAAMIPRAELEGEADGPTRIGLQASLMAKFLNKITKKIPRGRKPVLMIMNQTRTKIDIKNPMNTGEDAAGGKALKFFTSIRLHLEIVKKEGESGRGQKTVDQVYTQNRVRITAVKNKLASPFIRSQFVIEYGKGINNVVSVAELAEAKLGIMAGAGFFKYEGDTPGTSFALRGRENFLQHLLDKPETLKEIEARVIRIIHQEHAKELGIEKLSQGETAKEIEPEQSTISLEGSEEVAPTSEGMPTEET